LRPEAAPRTRLARSRGKRGAHGWLAVDRTRLHTYTLTNRDLGAEGVESARRDATFVNQSGAAEDLAVVLAIQRGLASGANECVTFGHFESAIVHFHRNLAAALGD
jgi:hypothetical protein